MRFMRVVTLAGIGIAAYKGYRKYREGRRAQ